jgi:hypothetical protein
MKRKLQLNQIEFNNLLKKIVEQVEDEYFKISPEEYKDLLKYFSYSGKLLTKYKKFEGKPLWITGDLDVSGEPIDSLGNISYIDGSLNISNTTNVQDLTTILENAKQSKIALDHLGPSTTGLADLADLELASMSGILVAPQSTALTICAINPVLRFSITADHRVADPADISLLAKSFIRNLR